MSEPGNTDPLRLALQRQADDDVRGILASVAGRRFLYQHIYVDCQLIEGSYVDGNPGHAAFLEGRREVGRFLLQRLNRLDQSLTAQMVTEGMTEPVIRESEGGKEHG